MQYGLIAMPSSTPSTLEFDAPLEFLQRLVASAAAADDASSFELNTMLGELMGGNVEVGVSDVERVTTRGTCLDAESICAICQDSIGTGNEQRSTLCGHTYCGGCIETWFNTSKKCPMCMCDVEELLIAENTEK
jgi:hypothetical protein